ncbi:hypothetical protein [Sanguibacter antarcticus]|uniref:Integral membrane protein n=1 Tax=Sanguibacter antarcticus TaxID=372484 RepID=A0A2A9E6U4_9MICO|nr:hypothetical protein [Sanguibacter antarcticus]PFG33900.1 hypothetical protein ATL42_1794 [Sanguibacter antarcticus]
MEILYDLLLVLHLVGWAIVLGGWFATLKDPGVYRGTLHGVLTALVTGILMVGIASASDEVHDPNTTKVAIKLLVALAVTALAVVARRKGTDVAPGVKHAIGGLTLVNIVIAVLV